MKLCTFEFEGRRHIGAEEKGGLVELQGAHAALAASSAGGLRRTELPLPGDLAAFFEGGGAALKTAREALAFVAKGAPDIAHHRVHYALDDVRLLAPLPRPGKILCAGVNYRGHLEEKPGATLPESPFFFAKLPSGVIAHGEPIVHPAQTRQLDFEVELAVVIGHKTRRATEEQAMAGVAGYTILHDVSARDIQFTDHQITLGKNFDTFAPMGPCVVPADEIPRPDRLRLRTWVNGKLMQDATTEDWVCPLPRLLSFLSHVMTLEPGDVVSTGTPAGVGVFRKPPVFLQPGDVVTMEIEGIGRLENPVVAASG